MKLKLGTRGSDLARTQSGWVARQLEAAGLETELVIISTAGDRSQAPSFGAIGAQGVFVREIEQALLEHEIDLAVHSFKDLPTASPSGLVVAAVPARCDVADWLLVRRGVESGDDALLPLARGARIGTSSARRQAWLRHFRPDLKIAALRGNVPTRIERLADGDYDAIVLAGAGIERLNEATDVLDTALARIERHRLDPQRFVPAPAQGALAVQCRLVDLALRDALATIDDPATHAAVEIERAALALAEGGCDTAFGAHARALSGEHAGTRTRIGADAGPGTGAYRFELAVMTERDGRILTADVAGSADGQLAAKAIAILAAARGSAA
jgi:hydroxymethylbilane synthase